MTLQEFQTIAVSSIPKIFPLDAVLEVESGVWVQKDGAAVTLKFSDDDAHRMTEQAAKERLVVGLSMLRNRLGLEEPSNKKLLDAVMA